MNFNTDWKFQLSLYGKEKTNTDAKLQVTWENTNKGTLADSKFSFTPLENPIVKDGYISFKTDKFGKYCCSKSPCKTGTTCDVATTTMFAATSN